MINASLYRISFTGNAPMAKVADGALAQMRSMMNEEGNKRDKDGARKHLVIYDQFGNFVSATG